MSQFDLGLKGDARGRLDVSPHTSKLIGALVFLPKRILYRTLYSALVGAIAVYVWRRR